MFYSLTGNITFTGNSFVALDCNGVAFKINTSTTSLRKTGGTGNKATFFTYMSVREDAIEIFGFADTDELDIFKLLIGISGVGPKAAVSVLSAFEISSLTDIISSGNYKAITKAQGIGPKTAQRIVLELKDKINITNISENQSSLFTPENENNINEAINALVVLGYTKAEATKALSGADATNSTDVLIKIGLNNLLRRN